MKEAVTPSCGSGWVLTIIGLIAGFAGVFQDSPSTAAFGLMLISVTMLLNLWVHRAARKIVLTQKCPERIFEGDTVRVRVILDNKTLARNVHARFSEWPTVAPSSRRRLIFSSEPDPGRFTERSYDVRCEVSRGRYQVSSALLRVSDPLGLFECRRRLQTDNEILVLPRIHAVPRSLLMATGLARFGTSEQHRRIGVSNEFLSARDYRHGDPRNRILWKQSARRDRLVVRENLAESEGGLVIVIDRNVSVDAPGVGSAILDSAARLAASLAHRATKSGESVALATGTGHHGLLKAGRSTEHMFRLMEVLADMTLALDLPLSQLLIGLKGQCSPSSHICVITTHDRPDRLESFAAMQALRQSGHRVVVALLPSPRDAAVHHGSTGEYIDGIHHVWIGLPNDQRDVA